jgi:hypothetical protein
MREREEQGASGVLGFAPVLPQLTLRQLAKVDADGVPASQGIVAATSRLQRRRAEREARRRLRDWYRSLSGQGEKAAEPDAAGDALPRTHGAGRRLGLAHYAPAIPWHSASVQQAGVLDPFVVSGYPPFDGPVIGESSLSGAVWRYDAWQPYQTHAATSVNGWVIGLMGSGKSMFLKMFATRETAAPWNRHVIIEGDPKGEWARVARSVGGQVVSVGAGSYLNVLDPGRRPAARSERDWRGDVLGIQTQAIRSIAAAMRQDGIAGIDEQESGIVDAALNHYLDREQTPTIAGLVDLLVSQWPEQTPVKGVGQTDRRSAADRLILLLNPLVEGAMAGAFERESTVDVDPASPMLVFDTGSASDGNEQKKTLYMAAMSATVERLCAQRDGLFRIVIAEEGHELLSNPELVRAWDRRIRLSGELGVSNWFLMHELGDLSSFGEEGSEHRNTMMGILTKSEAQVVYAQSSSSLEQMTRLLPDLTLREINTIRALPDFCALWRVGPRVRDVVRPYVGPEAYDVFQTDKNRQG